MADPTVGSLTSEPSGSEPDSDCHAGSIRVLKGFEGVRRRPGTYIDEPDGGSGLDHLVHEVVNSPVQECA
jgi:DNA gyrase/topoisomerase IV subunit B